MMKKKYVLFDFDGVIVNTEESNSYYLGLALKEFGVELTEKDKLRLIGTHDQQMLEELLKESTYKVTLEQLQNKRSEKGNTYENGDIRPMPNLVPMIQQLRKKGVKMAVVTSTTTKLIIIALNRMGILNLFDVIVCGDMCKKRKPDPECYIKAMSLLGAKSEECIVFEDSTVGIQAAKRAGIEVIAYVGSGVRQDISSADYSVADYIECEKIFNSSIQFI